MFIGLMVLMKKNPKKPWIILIALIGLVYGLVTSFWISDIKPHVLKDIYPEMTDAKLWNFSYASKISSFSPMVIL